MSVNPSFFSNASLAPSSPLCMYSIIFKCFNSTGGNLAISSFFVVNVIFLVPLYILILYMGFQQWRNGKTLSHSNHFTFHVLVTELLSSAGIIISSCGTYTDLPVMINVGILLFVINIPAHSLFHLLTCVERYLAVVHPITYLSLKKTKGIRIRNATIASVWLTCLLQTGILFTADKESIDALSYCSVSVVLMIMSFCSLSVLRVLIRPGPGEGGRDQGHIDQTKLKAFYTIMAILGALTIKCAGTLFTTALYNLPQLGESQRCGVWLSVVWFNIPSSLVLPLLFLHKTGKLCCKNNKSG